MATEPLHKTTSIRFKSAKRLRKKATASEAVLWELLQNCKLQNLKFRRQEPLYGYIADFYCHKLQLIIEVDGSYHYTPSQQVYDDERSIFLATKGITVLGLTNSQAENPQLAIGIIQKFIEVSRLPLLQGEGRG